MLTNRLIIDGTDAYNEYGLYMKDNSLCALLAWPQFKKIATNNWHEENGLEADLTAPLFDGRNVQLQFHLGHSDSASLSRALFTALNSSVNHTLWFPELGITYTMRYASNGAFSMNSAFDTLTITMAEDSIAKPTLGSTVTLTFANNSTQTFTVSIPSVNSVHLSDYRLDGFDFARFGMYVTKGTMDAFQKYGTVKENMARNVSSEDGVIYDTATLPTVTYQDVTLNLQLHTASVFEFWVNWYAMFALLMSNGEHIIEGSAKRLSCYYKSCKVGRFYPLSDGGIWCEFSVTLSVLKELSIPILGTIVDNTLVAIADDNNVVIS